MLVITREIGEVITIGDDIRIKVVETRNGVVRFGVDTASSSLAVVVPASLPMLDACASAPLLAVTRIKAIMSLRMRAVRGRAGNTDYSANRLSRH